jgi:bile acid-coenzyme A ligase
VSGTRSFARVLAAQAARDPDRIAVVSEHEGVALTAAEVDTHSTRVAHAYRARGVTRNSLVTVALSNSAEFVIACAAIWKAGATPNPLAPELAEAEYRAVQKLAGPSLVVGRPSADPEIPWISPGFVPDAVDDALPDSWADSWKAPATSGSTGTPKLVLAAAPALIDPDRVVAPFLPRRAVQLVTAPLWHSAQFTYAFRGLLTGHRLVLTDRFNEHRFTELVEQHRVSWTLLSPSAIHRLMRLRPHAELPSLESVLHLGAPCAPADKRALIDWLGADRVIEVYAGSESNGLTMIDGAEWLRKPGSAGKPIGGTQIRIQRLDGSAAGPDEIGHIWLRRGESPAYSYRGGSSRRTADGWDTLGDLGYLDRDGYLFVVDRAADVVDRAGTRVYPSRIEHALQADPDVRDAVVFADGAELAAIVDIADSDTDADTLLAFIRPRLTAAEMPTRITLTRSPLRNPAGKVRRSTFRTSRPTSLSA